MLVWFNLTERHMIIGIHHVVLRHQFIAIMIEEYRRLCHGRCALLLRFLDCGRHIILFSRACSFGGSIRTRFGALLSLDRIYPTVLIMDATALVSGQ